MNSKKILLYGVLVGIPIIALGFVLSSLLRIETREGEPVPPIESVTIGITGTVTAVNLDEMAFDGPARILVTADDGSLYEIALPSMGRALCIAKDSVVSPETISIGNRIEVRGDQTDGGSIVPCERETHYLRII